MLLPLVVFEVQLRQIAVYLLYALPICLLNPLLRGGRAWKFFT
jgi:hypothetical protein